MIGNFRDNNEYKLHPLREITTLKKKLNISLENNNMKQMSLSMVVRKKMLFYCNIAEICNTNLLYNEITFYLGQQQLLVACTGRRRNAIELRRGDENLFISQLSDLRNLSTS